MQFVVISFLVLALCELPVLHAKKVVVVMQRQVRRTPSSSWRNLMMMHAKKNPQSANTLQGHPRYNYPQGAQFYHPKNLQLAKEQYPQGGDDFDQGHEEINHVIVPHGKGITHAVSFGKGYIPFENYNDNRPSVSHHQDYKLSVPITHDIQYSPTTNLPSRPIYTQAYISQQADAYVRNQNKNQEEPQDRIQDRGAQQYVTGKSLYDSSSAGTIMGSHNGIVQKIQTISNKPRVYLTSGIPPANLSPTKQGIVLRDRIVLDDYERQLAELTKNWPSNFVNGNLIPGNIGNSVNQESLQQFGLSRQFDGHNTLQGFSDVTGFVSSLGQAQDQQGYAVKEDVVDTPHDFRTMPIQTIPVHQTRIQPQEQTLQQIPQQRQPLQQTTHRQIAQQQQPVQQIIHQARPLQHIIQQPVQQTLQHIFSQSQDPVNYGLQSFQGLVHG